MLKTKILLFSLHSIEQICISKILVQEMETSKQNSDKHFPVWGYKSSTLFSNPKKFCSYVKNRQVVADIGCGPGFYTLALADYIDNDGKVYAVDSNEKHIKALEKKLEKDSYNNIETHASSASNLNFIKDGSVDFIIANGLTMSHCTATTRISCERNESYSKTRRTSVPQCS
jgi:tRNA G46 methylase TrmB